ncbi:MAG: hypothetical protein SGI77_21135 [Pirellulaceae bacterium]|nr:hypothetical protein [Pirellulaceae bacterium]
MKLQQDFLGSAGRIRSKAAELDNQVAEVMDKWKDATAVEFQNQHLQPIADTLRRLMITLQDANELAAQFGKMLNEE